MDQISLLDDNYSDGEFKLIESNKENMQEISQHKFYHTEYKKTSYASLEEMFEGFNEIRAITFSYDIKFIDKIMKMFDYGEIILGGRFMVKRDDKLHKLTGEAYLLAEAMTLSEMAADAVRGQKNLVEMISLGDLQIRSPKFVIDHRKIYLLKADDGRTRLIKGSANMTGGGRSGNQLEVYEVDDSLEGYNAYLEDFETAWQLAGEIPEDVIKGKKTDQPENDIPLIKKSVETREAIVLEEKKIDKEGYELIKYTLDVEKICDKNKDLLLGVDPKSKNGFIEVSPDKIKKIGHNNKKLLRKKLDIIEVAKRYPALVFNYDTKEAFFDEEKLDLNPKEIDIKNDIDILFEAMDNYGKDFLGNTDRLQLTHYKLLNLLFSSPFNAKIRCVADIVNIPTSSLPLYTLIASTASNSGKTFMTELILKLMSGKTLQTFDSKSFPTANIEVVVQEYQGMPIFVDEIDGKYYGRLKNHIKNSHRCEKEQRDKQPMLIFAGNQVKDPEEPERKRMPFLRYDANLKSDIDPVSYRAKGIALQARASNAFYREYLRRMIDQVKDIIDFMIESESIPDGYYPDLLKISSKVLIEIFTDFGYSLPKYVKEFSWNDDFSYHAKHISEDAIEQIKKQWKNEPKTFQIKSDLVIIKSGSDYRSERMLTNRANSLPPEFEAKFSSTKENSQIIINRKELEERLGFKLNFLGKFLGR